MKLYEKYLADGKRLYNAMEALNTLKSFTANPLPTTRGEISEMQKSAFAQLRHYEALVAELNEAVADYVDTVDEGGFEAATAEFAKKLAEVSD